MKILLVTYYLSLECSCGSVVEHCFSSAKRRGSDFHGTHILTKKNVKTEFTERLPSSGHSVLLVKKIGKWELSLEAKRSNRALPKFSEPWAGEASSPPKRRWSSTTCLLLGSFCPAHALPSVSADRFGPTQEGRLPACRVASRRGRPGDLCMTPWTCCLSVLARARN